MFTEADLEIVLLDEVRRAIEENIGRRAEDVALDKRVPHAAVVATQVKRLQRAASKLPSLYAARAILPPLAYEQSSSEECAARKRMEGHSVLDLTCGLGIDTLALARRFERVVALERNEVLVRVVRENMRRLGVTNVEVVCCSAEEYLASCEEHFDWCFVDPDRRGVRGEKLFRLEECSPDVLSLRSRIAEVADCLCVKCSPLFDVGEAFRLFGACEVEVVSLGGECKEVNIYLGTGRSLLSAVALGCGELTVEDESVLANVAWSALPESLDDYRYLILPDVAVRHARLVAAMLRGRADVWSNDGVALSVLPPDGVLGRVEEIEEVMPFDAKLLKRRLKGRRIELLQRAFPLSNGELCRRLGVREGAEERWCFTTIGRKMFAIKVKN